MKKVVLILMFFLLFFNFSYADNANIDIEIKLLEEKIKTVEYYKNEIEYKLNQNINDYKKKSKEIDEKYNNQFNNELYDDTLIKLEKNKIDTLNEYDEEVILYKKNLIILLKQKKDNLKTTYNDLIDNINRLIEQQKNKTNIESQKATWELNKLGITSNTDNIIDQINKNGEFKTNELKNLIIDLNKELEYNLGIYDKQIKELENNINEKTNKKDDNYKISYDRGINLYNIKDYKTAIKYFNEALLYDEADLYSINYYLGLSYFNLGDYNNSEKFYNTSLEYAYNDTKKNKINIELSKINKIKEKINNELLLNEKLIEKAELIFNKLELKLSKLDDNKRFQIYNSLLIQLNQVKGKITGDKAIIINRLIELINKELGN